MSDNGITPLTPEQVAADEKATDKESYIHNVLVGLDQAANVITGGHCDETISSRLARSAERGEWPGILGSKLLGAIQHNHGALAQAGDLERAKVVEKLEEQSGFEAK